MWRISVDDVVEIVVGNVIKWNVFYLMEFGIAINAQ